MKSHFTYNHFFLNSEFRIEFALNDIDGLLIWWRNIREYIRRKFELTLVFFLNNNRKNKNMNPKIRKTNYKKKYLFLYLKNQSLFSIGFGVFFFQYIDANLSWI